MPLHGMLPKTSAYAKSYDGQLKWMYFLIEDDDLIKKYNTIWNKVSADIRKKFNSELVWNKEFLKTKVKFNVDEVTDSSHTCVAVISLDSALKKNGN